MKAPVFCLSGTFLWSLWSNKAFTQACHCLCPFQGFFPIRKEKLHLAKTRSPCERWVQLLPTIQVLLSSPEWHQDFGHPCRPSSFRAMRTPMDPLCHIHEKATGIWALEQSSNPHLPPPAPSHPHPQRWLHFQELMQLFGKVSRLGEMSDRPNTHLTKTFLIGTMFWWHRPGILFPVEQSRAESEKGH